MGRDDAGGRPAGLRRGRRVPARCEAGEGRGLARQGEDLSPGARRAGALLAASWLAICIPWPAHAQEKRHEVERCDLEYPSGDARVPAVVFTPRGEGRFPPVLFVHGRSGLNDRLQQHARRLAEHGFVVLAPDYHTPRFIPDNPVAHDPQTEGDVERGIDALLALPSARGRKVVVVGISRGGYHAGLLAARRTEVAGVVGYYPHLISPNAPEADQVYRYMPEVEQWKVPALLMVGDRDHQLRRELVVRVAERLKERGVEVELAVYPGAQRGFEFRTAGRTLGDDLARNDAMARTVRFVRRVLGES